ncbi:MAG: hypothetical protein K2X03_11600 [Bryobacteraceae bacterium]|nr:hypothetical protein [Bryobacteraceae bacterium]
MNGRVVSMDQFRGYTVAGMFLVNFIGGFAAVHPVFQHHNTYCSYADTIMPQFFFAVGFALRLVLLRNLATLGASAAYRKAIWRGLALLLLGLVVYHLDGRYRLWRDLVELGWWGFLSKSFWREPFQALVHIAITSLWILPVVACGVWARITWGVGSGLLHLLLSQWFWYDLLHEKRVIDGGALGFLTWSLPALAGTLAYDFATRPASLLRWGGALMLVGYLFSSMHGWAAPPFWPPVGPVDLWTMSQRAGSLSYQTFSAGFSLAVYSSFIWLVDRWGYRLSLFDTLGQNALAGYLLHSMVADVVQPFAPKDSPLWWVSAMFAVYFYLTYRMVRYLNEHRMYLRL